MTKPTYFTEHMGTLLTEEADDCLRLQSLLQGVSRGELVRGIIDKYIDKNKLTSDILAERYAQYIYTEWDLRFREKMKFSAFIKQQQVIMKKLQHPDRLVDKVTAKCEEAAQKASENK